MPNISNIASRIKSFHADIAQAAEDSQKSEKAFALAKRDAKTACRDDGLIPPADLYERRNLAERNLFMRQTEAQRANEKLASLEDEFEKNLRQDGVVIIRALEGKVESAKAAMKEQLSPLVSKGDSHSLATLDSFILVCDEVATRHHALYRARFIHGLPSGDGVDCRTLAQPLEAAIELL